MKQSFAAAALALAASGPALSGPADTLTLGAAAASSGRYFGAALDPNDFDEQRYRRACEKTANHSDPGDETPMKSARVEPLRGQFDWKRADALVPSPDANRQKIRPYACLA